MQFFNIHILELMILFDEVIQVPSFICDVTTLMIDEFELKNLVIFEKLYLKRRLKQM